VDDLGDAVNMTTGVEPPREAMEGFKKLFKRYWDFATIMLTLVGGIFFALKRYDAILWIQDSQGAELERQSFVDSVSATQRWEFGVGMTYLICADSANNSYPAGQERAIARAGCREHLRYVPALRSTDIPTRPSVRVFRRNDMVPPGDPLRSRN
jgi:hypothetical protein